MSLADDIRQRMKHTTARLKHLGSLTRALKGLQAKRRKQLAKLKPKPRGKLEVFGIDYAWGTPNIASLRTNGVRFVMRYISHDSGKDLDAAELKQLHAAGIKVGVVFETTANRALAGYDAGKFDAQFANGRVRSLGLDGIPIYFAVDFDATESQKPQIARYLNGAASVIGKDRVGVYGGYHVVKYMANLKVCDWFWQTYAWSGGLVHPDAHVYQYSNGHRLGGVSCDFNKARSGPGGYGVR